MMTIPATDTRLVYDGLAAHYDAFTAHHDYHSWIAALEEQALEHGLPGRRVLDVACGTGKSFLPLLAKGYVATGCDCSAEMLCRAREKAPNVALFQADMRELPPLGQFDLVTCLDDALNYLLSSRDLGRAFASASRNLAPGGLYVFDVNTLTGYATTWASTSFSEHDGRAFVWRGQVKAPAQPLLRATALIEIFTQAVDGTWSRATSRHAQRHHPEPLVRELLADAGFCEVTAYGQLPNGSVESGADELGHHKVVYFARRETRAVRR
jgi:ubiquinone/menaquinone biosynthesis C-methylase UbiE